MALFKGRSWPEYRTEPFLYNVQNSYVNCYTETCGRTLASGYAEFKHLEVGAPVLPLTDADGNTYYMWFFPTDDDVTPNKNIKNLYGAATFVGMALNYIDGRHGVKSLKPDGSGLSVP